MAKKDQAASFRQDEGCNSTGKRSVSCMICQAVYAPSQLRSDLLQASPLALESTLMSMCHFCFRCRRPSCPDCWDHIHGLCAACDQDARLPFRTELPPLYGTLLSPLRQTQTQPEPVVAAPLHLVQPGVYAQKLPLPIDKVTTRPEAFLPLPTKTLSPTSISVTKSASRVSHVSSPLLSRKPALIALRQLRRIALWLFFLVLLCVLILIITAPLSTEVNATILAIFHVDVRREIVLLLQFFRQLFS